MSDFYERARHALQRRINIVKGAVGYLRFPQQKTSFGGPFNGQEHRIRMFRELHRVYRFSSIFETGAYRGTTTEFLARESGGRIWTAEADAWSYGYCLARFFLNNRIKPSWRDSRDAIRIFIAKTKSRDPIFFYLDAHWGADLPLRTELELIFSRWDNAIVMIDDFKIDGDPDYMYDDYGGGNCICMDYIAPVVRKFRPRVYVPSLPGNKESGARRGSAVLLGSMLPVPQSFATMNEIPHALVGA